MAVSYVHGNERGFLDQLSDCQLLKKDTALWNKKITITISLCLLSAVKLPVSYLKT
jgi:hypothetical protein